MTQGNPSRHETARAIWRKKVKKINMLALDTVVLWQPPANRQMILLHAIAKVRNHEGVNSDDPEIQIDNGTNGQNNVAAVDLASQVVGDVQRLAVVGNYAFDYDHPLRLRITDAPAGSTVYDVDLILVALEISEIQS